MAKTRKKTNKGASEIDFTELISFLTHQGTGLAKKGIDFLEETAKKKNLHKEYKYLAEAFENVKGVINFFHMSMQASNEKEVKKNERTKRKKSNKKVPKQKTVRHRR